MRMSCNGCRVLRKGCSENCSIRPCLQWIKTPESQANATVFLAKFYGRAGLMNLINSGPQHLRPAIFRSLLYEACGRIVNPIYGSVGLLWSGSWQLCQAAVEAVLKGAPIMQISSEVAAGSSTPPLKAYDIRHVSKDDNSSAASQDLHKVRTRNRFKRTTAKPKSINNNNNNNNNKMCGGESAGGADQAVDDDDDSAAQVWPLSLERAPSHESSLSHQTTEMNGGGESDSMFSVETVEASLMSRAEPEPVPVPVPKFDQDCYQVGLGLDLTLGLEPSVHSANRVKRVVGPSDEMNGSDAETCKMELGLDYSA